MRSEQASRDDPRAFTTPAFSSTRISAASSYHKDDPEGPLPRRGALLSVHIQLRTPGKNAVRWRWRRRSSRLSSLQLAATDAPSFDLSLRMRPRREQCVMVQSLAQQSPPSGSAIDPSAPLTPFLSTAASPCCSVNGQSCALALRSPKHKGGGNPMLRMQRGLARARHHAAASHRVEHGECEAAS